MTIKNDQYKTGHSFEASDEFCVVWKHFLEYEFVALSGLPNLAFLIILIWIHKHREQQNKQMSISTHN